MRPQILAQVLERPRRVLDDALAVLFQAVVGERVGVALEMRSDRLVCAVAKPCAARVVVGGKVPVRSLVGGIDQEPMRPMPRDGIGIAARDRSGRRRLSLLRVVPLVELAAEQIGVAPRVAAPSGSPYGEGDIPLRGEDERMSTFFIVMAFLFICSKGQAFSPCGNYTIFGKPSASIHIRKLAKAPIKFVPPFVPPFHSVKQGGTVSIFRVATDTPTLAKPLILLAKIEVLMVGRTRFELVTFCTPSKRATRLRYRPTRA